jgi:hypothetical protein
LRQRRLWRSAAGRLVATAAWQRLARRPERPDRVGDRPAGEVEQIGLLLEEIRGLAERGGRGPEGGGLAAHGRGGLIDELQGRLGGGGDPREQLALELELALEDALEELGLALEGTQQRAGGPGGEGGGGAADLAYGVLPGSQ